jgi:hypothetical protein
MIGTSMVDGHRQHVVKYARKRIADPAETAQALRFLTSEESSCITGSAFGGRRREVVPLLPRLGGGIDGQRSSERKK